MERICTCNRIPEKDKPYSQEYCWLCYLYHADPTYNQLFGGDLPQPNRRLIKKNRKPIEGMFKRVWNYVLAAKAETEYRSQGGLAPTEEEKSSRLAICNACSDKNAENNSCERCGCYLESRLLPPIPIGKIEMATQNCPRGLWGYTGGYVPKSSCGGCGKKG